MKKTDRESKAKALPHEKVFVRLAPSKIHGVGVFAIRDIPKATNLFENDNCKLIWLNKTKVEHVHTPGLEKLYRDFCIYRGDSIGCPQNFNVMTVAWYLNHSEKPNARCDAHYEFIALRRIKKGEELTVDYRTYSD